MSEFAAVLEFAAVSGEVSFREHVDGTTRTLYGYQLVIPRDVRRVQYDPTQPCAQTVLDLFRKLRGDGVEVIADARY